MKIIIATLNWHTQKFQRRSISEFMIHLIFLLILISSHDCHIYKFNMKQMRGSRNPHEFMKMTLWNYRKSTWVSAALTQEESHLRMFVCLKKMFCWVKGTDSRLPWQFLTRLDLRYAFHTRTFCPNILYYAHLSCSLF